MKKPKLEIELQRNGAELTMRILKQDRRIKRGMFSATAKNGIFVCSVGSPQVLPEWRSAVNPDGTIFLRGLMTAWGRRKSTRSFNTPADAVVARRRVLEALREFFDVTVVAPPTREEIERELGR